MRGHIQPILLLYIPIIILPVLSNLIWDTASPKVLSEAYSPYELCALKLTAVEYDIKRPVFDQPRCTHLIDSFHVNLPKRCWLGGLHQPHDDGLCIGNAMKGDVSEDKKCSYLTDRKGFFNNWDSRGTYLLMNDTISHLSRGHSNRNCKVQFLKYPGYAAALLKTATKNNFEIIAFAGDSMAVQVTQRLACAVLRANMTMHVYGNMFSVRPSGASALIDDSSFLPNFGLCEIDSNIRKRMNVTLSAFNSNPNDMQTRKSIMLSTYKYFNGIGKSDFKQKKLNAIPGIEAKCGIPGHNATCRREVASAHIYKTAMTDFRGSKKWLNTLHFLLLPVALKYDWEFESIAIALNELALKIHPHGSRIVILAPFSQHFPSNPQGLYDNYTSTKNTNDSKICKKHTKPFNSINIHKDSYNFQLAMNKTNPKWRDLLGFFESTTEISAPWDDLHPESKSYGWPVDCTHYAFQPLMFEKIWHSLGSYLEEDHTWLAKKEKVS